MQTPMHKHTAARPTPGVQQRSPALALKSPARMPRAYEKKDAFKNLEYRSYAVKLDNISDQGVITGYGSVFNILDSYGDIIVPGAFKNSLSLHKEAGTMPAMLWQHKDDQPIGVWQEMYEDDKGLAIKGQLCLEVQAAKEAYALLKQGAVNGLSIGFVKVDWKVDEKTDIRTLNVVDLWEVSPVTFPANGKSRITNVKSASETLATPKDAERILRDAGFSKADATAYVSSVMRMGESRSESARAHAQALEAAQQLLRTLTT